MSENTAANNVVTELGRFRIVYAMKDEPHGHADYVVTRTAKEIGIEGVDEKAYFVRVLLEHADTKLFHAQTLLIADQQPLNIDEIAEHCTTAKITHQNSKGKCLGIYIEKEVGKYEYFFLNSQKNIEEILPIIHPKIFLLLNFLVEEKAILDYRIVCLSKIKVKIEMVKKKNKEGIPCELRTMSGDGGENMATAIFLTYYENFASENHTTWSRILFTKLYNEAEKRMLRWGVWAKENLQLKGGSK